MNSSQIIQRKSWFKIYACFDGIPEYLLRINPEESPKENIIENFFRKGYMYAILEALGDRGRSFQREVNNRKKKREKLPFKFELIGKWWNRLYEIDLITVNETQRKVIFWEAERICKSLKERAQIVKEYKKIMRSTMGYLPGKFQISPRMW